MNEGSLAMVGGICDSGAVGDVLHNREVILIMPETMRLNHTVACDGCGTNVNPYVLEQKWDKPKLTVHLECPTCKHDWWTELEA